MDLSHLTLQPQDEVGDLLPRIAMVTLAPELTMARRMTPTLGLYHEPHGYSRGQPGPCAWCFFSSSPKIQLGLEALPDKAS